MEASNALGTSSCADTTNHSECMAGIQWRKTRRTDQSDHCAFRTCRNYRSNPARLVWTSSMLYLRGHAECIRDPEKNLWYRSDINDCSGYRWQVYSSVLLWRLSLTTVMVSLWCYNGTIFAYGGNENAMQIACRTAPLLNNAPPFQMFNILPRALRYMEKDSHHGL